MVFIVFIFITRKRHFIRFLWLYRLEIFDGLDSEFMGLPGRREFIWLLRILCTEYLSSGQLLYGFQLSRFDSLGGVESAHMGSAKIFRRYCGRACMDFAVL